MGANIGFLTILYSWTQTLLFHPHLHCLVPGGGLAPDGSRWVACRDTFFLSIRVLSRMFRGKFLALLDQAARRGEIRLAGPELYPYLPLLDTERHERAVFPPLTMNVSMKTGCPPLR